MIYDEHGFMYQSIKDNLSFNNLSIKNNLKYFHNIGRIISMPKKQYEQLPVYKMNKEKVNRMLDMFK